MLTELSSRIVKINYLLDFSVNIEYDFNMKLIDWQKWKGISNKQLAEMITQKARKTKPKANIDHTIISHWRGGRRNPSPLVALIIEEITEGQVTKEELVWPD